jgi:hypothetical protein
MDTIAFEIIDSVSKLSKKSLSPDHVAETNSAGPKPVQKVLIATPAYGGLVTTGLMNSILAVMTNKEVRSKYEIHIATIGNDALVQRARQELVKIAMEQKVNKILFIDADIIFSSEDFLNVVDQVDFENGQHIVGGTYRKKSNEQVLNFNIDTNIELDIRNKWDNIPASKPAGFRILKQEYADKNGLVPALHLPTGFLCIDMQVFEELKPHVNNYVSDRRDNTKMFYSQDERDQLKVWEFFPVMVNNHILESEDWAFCTIANKHGFKCFLQTRVVVGHIANLPLYFQT